MKFETVLKYHEWFLCQISIQIMLFCVYITAYIRFVIFTCRYFKLSWNTTALSQSNCRNFSCSSINHKITSVAQTLCGRAVVSVRHGLQKKIGLLWDLRDVFVVPFHWDGSSKYNKTSAAVVLFPLCVPISPPFTNILHNFNFRSPLVSHAAVFVLSCNAPNETKETLRYTVSVYV